MKNLKDLIDLCGNGVISFEHNFPAPIIRYRKCYIVDIDKQYIIIFINGIFNKLLINKKYKYYDNK